MKDEPCSPPRGIEQFGPRHGRRRRLTEVRPASSSPAKPLPSPARLALRTLEDDARTQPKRLRHRGDLSRARSLLAKALSGPVAVVVDAAKAAKRLGRRPGH